MILYALVIPCFWLSRILCCHMLGTLASTHFDVWREHLHDILFNMIRFVEVLIRPCRCCCTNHWSCRHIWSFSTKRISIDRPLLVCLLGRGHFRNITDSLSRLKFESHWLCSKSNISYTDFVYFWWSTKTVITLCWWLGIRDVAFLSYLIRTIDCLF